MKVYSFCAVLALTIAAGIYAGPKCTARGCNAQMNKAAQADCPVVECTADEEKAVSEESPETPVRPKMGRGERGVRRPGPPSIDRRLEHLTKRLELTEAQQESIKAVLAVEKEKIEVLRKGETKPRDRQVEIRKIHRETFAAINALLTPDQQKIHNEMGKKMVERMEERRENRRKNRRENWREKNNKEDASANRQHKK